MTAVVVEAAAVALQGNLGYNETHYNCDGADWLEGSMHTSPELDLGQACVQQGKRLVHAGRC